MVKTLQLKIHKPTKYKKMLLDKTIKRYNLVYNEMLKDAKTNIDIIISHYCNDNGKYTAQTISKFFSGKDYHKKYGIEPLYDSLKFYVSTNIASYLELKKYLQSKNLEDNTQFPFIKRNKKNIIKKIKKYEYKIINDIMLTNEQQHELEQKIKKLKAEIDRINDFVPISFSRFDEKRDACLLYSPKKNRYYVKLYIMGREESIKVFKNHKPKNIEAVKDFDELIYLPSGHRFETDKTKPQPYIILPLEFGLWHEKYLKMIRKGEATPSAMKLIKRNEDYYIDLPVNIGTDRQEKWKKFDKEKIIKTETRLGIDMGVACIASIAVVKDIKTEPIFTKKFIEETKEYNEAFERYVEKLIIAQKNCSNYPQDKKYIQGILHRVANEIIKIAVEYKSDIYVEDLNIDKSTKRIKSTPKFQKYNKKTIKRIVKQLNRWAYGELYKILKYKAEINNLTKVRKVNPKFTSEECSMCGHNEIITSNAKNENRETQSLFVCKKCGFTYDADINAAINIANRYYNTVKLKSKELNNMIIVEHNLFDIQGMGCDSYYAIQDFLNKLKKYYDEYKNMSAELKKDKKLKQQYAILAKLDYSDYEKYFSLV